ncbi:MAG: RNA polymerase sigma factor [Alicyclobacillus sp.]|nr:RNA polymerase sigma factor [Alicyclobacillus sp.]
MSQTDCETTSEEAIVALYDAYANDIYRFALHVLGNVSDAEDTVQEVFLRAHANWQRFRHESKPKTWLLAIARNCMNDWFRQKRVQLSRYGDDENDLQASEPDVSAENWVDLHRALSNLNSNERSVIILRYFQDLSSVEIARVLGWSSANVRTTQHRAVKKLKAILTGDEQFSLNTRKAGDNYGYDR